MAKILASFVDNESISVQGKDIVYIETINSQKVRRALGGRPAGTECGNSCSCS